MAVFESDNAQAALDALKGREIDSKHWSTNHPHGRTPGLSTLLELAAIRKELEELVPPMDRLRGYLASALYCGKPAGAIRIIDVGGAEESAQG